MLEPFGKWTVCFWDVVELGTVQQKFELLDSKEEVLEFVDQRMEEHGTMWNDFGVFAPYAGLDTPGLLSHGVPERFKQKIK
jgi:hypothetical protein